MEPFGVVVYVDLIDDKNGEVSVPSSILLTTGDSSCMSVVRVVRGRRRDLHEGTSNEEEDVMTGLSRVYDLLAQSSSRGPIPSTCQK